MIRGWVVMLLRVGRRWIVLGWRMLVVAMIGPCSAAMHMLLLRGCIVIKRSGRHEGGVAVVGRLMVPSLLMLLTRCFHLRREILLVRRLMMGLRHGRNVGQLDV